MAKEYSLRTQLGGSNIISLDGAAVCVFASGAEGEACLELWKTALAQTDATLFDETRQIYLVADAGMLAR